MNLDRVTITGADNSIGHPENLLPLTKEFPFVEWGILASSSQMAGPRFPSLGWIHQLQDVASKNEVKLSLHLCGRWVRELLLGNITMPSTLIEGPTFQRIQLNFHAERTECRPHEFFTALLALGKRQHIFQIDGATGNKHLEAIYAENDDGHSIDAVPLFDISGGAGVLPVKWPRPMYMSNDVDHCYHGYAGGLGPESLVQQLPLIGEAAGETRIWIDMETRVRSANDLQFDLTKVRRCLEICAPLASDTVLRS